MRPPKTGGYSWQGRKPLFVANNRYGAYDERQTWSGQTWLSISTRNVTLCTPCSGLSNVSPNSFIAFYQMVCGTKILDESCTFRHYVHTRPPWLLKIS